MPLIPAPKFLKSKKLYAIDPASFEVTSNQTHPSDPTKVGDVMHRYSMQAVWFGKRSNGLLAAFSGELWDFSSSRDGGPWNVDDFIQNVKTARYGATPLGCWDGYGAWWSKPAADDYALQQEVLPFYQNMLANYPAIPSGYHGWFSFVD